MKKKTAPPSPVATFAKCGIRRTHTTNKRSPTKDRLSCARATGHDGPHRALAPEGNHVTEWDRNGERGAVHIPKERFDLVTFEQRVESATHCGYCESQLDDDGSCEACLSGRTPHQIKKDRAAAEQAPEAPARDSVEHHPPARKDPEPDTKSHEPAPTDSQAGTTILGYRRHPAAMLFPLMEGEAFERFADRIQANGLRDAIERVTIGGETFILDGSNRGRACELRGVEPRFKDYEGPKDMGSLVDYSIDKNGDGRRHLDASVRAMIATDAAQLGRGNPGDRESGRSAGLKTQAEAGARLGVSERLVRRAKVVRDKGTAKVNEAVMKGKLAVEAAELVTKLPAAKQDAIADEALAKKSGAVRSGRVRALVKQEEKRDVVRKINEQRVAPMPDGEFGVIYGDYPWLYENSDQHDGSRGHMGYPPMTMDEIVAHAREASKRAAKDCIVVLWVTNLYAPQIGRVLEAYGAEHRTMWTWPKPRAGVGTWGRGQTEHLVIASIGAPVHTLNELSTLLKSYPPEHLNEHSSKPAEVAALLRKHCAGPFLELFAREPRIGWTCWGAEVDKFATEAA